MSAEIRDCFSFPNLSNIPSSTGLQGASTTWTSFVLLAENWCRSFGHWAADIPDNVDYWSNFFEVVKIHRRTAQAAITQFKVQFARHGIPEVLISNNGPEFDNQEFKNFSTDWQFEHRTSGSRYPQANGKVENAVKTCKGLLLKAEEDKRDPLLAILSWRNTPSEGFSTSPVQRLMGRRMHTLLPTAEKLLQPNSNLFAIFLHYRYEVFSFITQSTKSLLELETYLISELSILYYCFFPRNLPPFW